MLKFVAGAVDMKLRVCEREEEREEEKGKKLNDSVVGELFHLKNTRMLKS